MKHLLIYGLSSALFYLAYALMGGGSVWSYIDTAQIFFMMGMGSLSLLQFRFKEIRNAIKTLVGGGDSCALSQTQLLIQSINRSLIYSLVIAVFIGLYSLLKHPNHNAYIGSALAITLLGGVYLLLLRLLFIKPLEVRTHLLLKVTKQ